MIDKSIDYFGIRAAEEGIIESPQGDVPGWGSLFRKPHSIKPLKTKNERKTKPKNNDAWQSDAPRIVSAEYIEENWGNLPFDGVNLNRDELDFIPVKRKRQKRIKCDPALKRITSVIRTNILGSFNRRAIEKGCRTTDILGVSFREFKIYLESLFEPWMSWENYGHDKLTGKIPNDIKIGWHLDHIVPTSSAATEEDVHRLNYYTNFQPMCAYENTHIKAGKINYVRDPELHLIFMSSQEILYPSSFKIIRP